MSARNPIDLSGERFGRWLVLDRDLTKCRTSWRCRCNCGTEKSIAMYTLLNGNSKSCGCLRNEKTILTHTTHGETRSPEYYTWMTMKARCCNPKSKSYCYYGARGIVICERWLNSFEFFLADMGKRPSSEHQIDRIDSNGNYEPSNCRWATRKEQGRNKSCVKIITYKGKTLRLPELADLFGINPKLLRERLQRGWTVERAIETVVVWHRRKGTEWASLGSHI